jgi:hypothetical protein
MGMAQEVRQDGELGDAGKPGGALDPFHALTALIWKSQSSPKVSSVRNACSSAQVPRESRTTRVFPPLPVNACDALDEVCANAA